MIRRRLSNHPCIYVQLPWAVATSNGVGLNHLNQRIRCCRCIAPSRWCFVSSNWSFSWFERSWVLIHFRPSSKQWQAGHQSRSRSTAQRLQMCCLQPAISCWAQEWCHEGGLDILTPLHTYSSFLLFFFPPSFFPFSLHHLHSAFAGRVCVRVGTQLVSCALIRILRWCCWICRKEGGVQHVPCTLFPTPFPEKEFKKVSKGKERGVRESIARVSTAQFLQSNLQKKLVVQL